MISYFELLQMIKVGNIPKKVKLHFCGTTKEYCADYDIDDFSHYELCNKKEKDEDYKFYLSECFLESDMFDKSIEIVENENNEYFYTNDNRYNELVDIVLDLQERVKEMENK